MAAACGGGARHARARGLRRGAGAGYRALERQALRILVARAQLEVAASRLGISFGDDEARPLAGRAPPRRREAIELAYEGAALRLVRARTTVPVRYG